MNVLNLIIYDRTFNQVESIEYNCISKNNDSVYIVQFR